MSADDLVRYFGGKGRYWWDGHRQLDYRIDSEVIVTLAKAARLAPAKVKNLLIVADDGATGCWHRGDYAWCPECAHDDAARSDEIYIRAAWRLGSCVVCPKHKVLLEDTCWRCEEGVVAFQGKQGLAKLTCNRCATEIYPVRRRADEWWHTEPRPFGVFVTPGVIHLVGCLQQDLQAALTGRRLRRSWGFGGSASGLLAAVCDLTRCLIATYRCKCEPRFDINEARAGHKFDMIEHPITPAVLPTHAAFGALAIAAAVFRSLERPDDPAPRWSPNFRGENALTAESVVASFHPLMQSHLLILALKWRDPAGKALRAVIADSDSSSEWAAKFLERLAAPLVNREENDSA